MAGLRADEKRIGGIEADRAFDHLFGARNVGALQVDLVDDGNDFEAVIDGEIGVREGLRFDALRRVDHQQRAFAGGERARDFIGKIDVAGSVDQVELVSLAILRGIHHADGVGFDGDAALALEVHGVENLLLHFAHGERAGQLQQAVGERGFAVIDVRDDRKIADEGGFHEDSIDSSRRFRRRSVTWQLLPDVLPRLAVQVYNVGVAVPVPSKPVTEDKHRHRHSLYAAEASGLLLIAVLLLILALIRYWQYINWSAR